MNTQNRPGYPVIGSMLRPLAGAWQDGIDAATQRIGGFCGAKTAQISHLPGNKPP
jgi:hypothetical protein